MRVRDRTCTRAPLGRIKQNEQGMMLAVLLVIALLLFVGCDRHVESPIAPLVGAEPQHVATASTATRELKSVMLPTPHIQTAPQGYYQDDNGLRLAISEIETQAIPESDQGDRTLRYVVLALALTNYGEQPKDVTGFPFAVWLHEQTTNEDYAPEVYTPSDTSFWFALDKLNRGTVKSLERNQTIRGELYFKVPATTTKVDLIWQPDTRRQWILQVHELR